MALQRGHRHCLHRRYCLFFCHSGLYPGGRALRCCPGGTQPSGHARRYSSCHSGPAPAGRGGADSANHRCPARASARLNLLVLEAWAAAVRPRQSVAQQCSRPGAAGCHRRATAARPARTYVTQNRIDHPGYRAVRAVQLRHTSHQ